MSLFEELKRRNVIRVMAAYMVLSWLLLQVGDTLLGAFDVPDWGLKLLVALLVLGFIPAVVFSWAYELTPEGFKKETEVDPSAAVAHQAERKLDIITITMIVLAIGVLVADRIFVDRESAPAVSEAFNQGQEDQLPTALDRSIAVLPFEAMSSDQSDMYLGRAIAEETLNRLAKIHDLKVAARTSAFALSDGDMDVKQIGAQLGVAYILEGSVRRAGDKIRITAQLIRTSDGYHIWTETFEPELVDLFLIEDRIVAEISRTLQIRLGVGIGSGTASGEGVDPEAFETYLNGLGLWSSRMRNDENRMNAFSAFERATELDPNFAAAWAALGSAGIGSKGSPLARNKEVFSQTVGHALERALELAPNDVGVLTSAAHWQMSEYLDFDGARKLLEKAHEIDSKQAEFGYAGYWALTGEPEKALAARDKIAALDPLNYNFLRIRADFQATIDHNDDALSFYNECQAKACLREGFIAFGTTVALLSKNPDEIARWKSFWNEFHAFIKTLPQSELPQVVKVVPTYFATEFGDPEAEQLQMEMIKLFETDPVTDTIGQWGPTFARFMPLDLFMDTLELAYERGDLFGASFDLMPFYGQNNYPDQLLKHPRYHALWEKPGLKELQALRRANGKTASLPLLASENAP